MNNQPKWKEFERLVAAIHHTESKGATIIWNDKIDGRQFDVTVRFKNGLYDYLTVIECKDYNHNVPVEKIDALVTKAKDINADKAVMVSAHGYQSGCYPVAKRHGISLLVLNEKVELDIGALVSQISPAINIYHVKLVLNDHSKLELEDEGGSLHYLMKNTKISSGKHIATPDSLITDWQLSNQISISGNDNTLTIFVPHGATAYIPHKKPIHIKGLQFSYRLTQAFIANGPFIDNHIREGINTKVELIDESGNIKHSSGLSEIKHGFDTVLKPGKFYLIPSLHNYYYCKSITNDTVTWILVESYQHGRLVQSSLEQDVQYSSYYVEVTDKKKLHHLQTMLSNYLKVEDGNSS